MNSNPASEAADSHEPLRSSTIPSPTDRVSTEKQTKVQDIDAKPAHDQSFNRGPRFWAIMATLCVVGLLSALENTVVTTSLPFIVNELHLGENYIWVTNVFFLTR